MGQKTLFSKKNKRGYKRLFCICFRQVSIEQIQTSLIHIAPCSQEIIDNENADCLRFFEEFGHKDFHITDFITKCQILSLITMKI
jgi:hypothetical protein